MTSLSRRLLRLEQRIVPARPPRHHIVFGDDPVPEGVGPGDTVHRIRFVDPPIEDDTAPTRLHEYQQKKGAACDTAPYGGFMQKITSRSESTPSRS
jgi:hypothetical protein